MSYNIIFCIETFNIGGGATIALMSLIKNNPDIKDYVIFCRNIIRNEKSLEGKIIVGKGKLPGSCQLESCQIQGCFWNKIWQKLHLMKSCMFWKTLSSRHLTKNKPGQAQLSHKHWKLSSDSGQPNQEKKRVEAATCSQKRIAASLWRMSWPDLGQVSSVPRSHDLPEFKWSFSVEVTYLCWA